MMKHSLQRLFVPLICYEVEQAGDGVVPEAGFGITIDRVTIARGPGAWHAQRAGFTIGDPFDGSACDNVPRRFIRVHDQSDEPSVGFLLLEFNSIFPRPGTVDACMKG